MNTTTSSDAAASPPSRLKCAAPVILLLLLSPIIGEVLSGATRLSYIFVLVPQVMVWGCGALIIRELTRRWQGGIATMVLLGLALAVAEEFIIQQTSLAPLPWLTTQVAYGRLWDVNWIYFLYMLGYETVWVVLVPILVVELLLPQRRSEPWLRTRGLVIAGSVFVLGAFIAWFLWVKQARTQVFNMPDYQPPGLTLLLGLLAIASLVFAAYAVRASRPQRRPNRSTPRPLFAGVAAIAFGLPWYVLIVLVFVPTPAVPFWAWMIAGTAWAIAAYRVLGNWAQRPGWGAMHGWALAFGALVVNMGGGYLGSNYWAPVDLYGKIVMNAIAIVCMFALARRIRTTIARRVAPARETSPAP
jgi:hypothetical protein